MKTEKLLSVEIFDSTNNMWQIYDCPEGDTIKSHIEWLLSMEDSNYWATLIDSEVIRLNGKYTVTVDGVTVDGKLIKLDF